MVVRLFFESVELLSLSRMRVEKSNSMRSLDIRKGSLRVGAAGRLCRRLYVVPTRDRNLARWASVSCVGVHPGAYTDPVGGVEVVEDQAWTNIPTTVIPNQSSFDPPSSSTFSIYLDLKLFIRRCVNSNENVTEERIRRIAIVLFHVLYCRSEALTNRLYTVMTR